MFPQRCCRRIRCPTNFPSITPVHPCVTLVRTQIHPFSISQDLIPSPTWIGISAGRPNFILPLSLHRPRFPFVKMVQNRPYSTERKEDVEKPGHKNGHDHRNNGHQHSHSFSLLGHSHPHGEEHARDAEQIIAALKGSGVFR
jgi:hypothetical protein